MGQIVRSPEHSERLVIRWVLYLGAFDLVLHVVETVVLWMK